jgi:phage terminase large subunit-like protein
MDILDIKKKEIQLLHQRKLIQDKIQQGLPHLYGWKWYQWAWDFFETRNKTALLVAANQISKSSTQIRKVIHWATETDLWPTLWKSTPRQFWYLYPSQDVVDAEFFKKWVPEFMPKDQFKDHPKYGWKALMRKGRVYGVDFATGVTLFFKTYTQDVHNLQTGTVHYVACDEELPVEYYDELRFRLAASDGYFSMVFTATLGQDFWHCCIEKINTHQELLKEAFKRQISMYDCLYYMDGSKSHWTKGRIQEIKNQCKSDAEIQRRVYGRFIKDEGLKYPCFTRERNMIKPFKIPADYKIYSGVDIGSGSDFEKRSFSTKSHASAIVFLAVKPDYSCGYIFKGWIGVDQLTTASDVLDKYRLLRGNMRLTMQCYDHAAKDFYTYASRLGETFTKAEKSHDIGEDIINILFKNKMLFLFDIPELQPLAAEFLTVSKDISKKYAKDDFVDAARYCITLIPWDYTVITDEYQEEIKKKEAVKSEVQKRREWVFGEDFKKEEELRIENEIEEYNQLY